MPHVLYYVCMSDHQRIVAVASGDNHSLLLNCSGHILAFGVGSEGRLGTGNLRDEWYNDQSFLQMQKEKGWQQ